MSDREHDKLRQNCRNLSCSVGARQVQIVLNVDSRQGVILSVPISSKALAVMGKPTLITLSIMLQSTPLSATLKCDYNSCTLFPSPNTTRGDLLELQRMKPWRCYQRDCSF